MFKCSENSENGLCLWLSWGGGGVNRRENRENGGIGLCLGPGCGVTLMKMVKIVKIKKMVWASG